MPVSHPVSVKFWYPSNVAEGAATYSVTMKAPELGNTNQLGRNQQIVRLRSGKTLVYDRGVNLNQSIHLDFKDILDSERSALVVFLGLVNWGASKLKYKDHLGVVRTVRVTTNSIEYSDGGLSNRATSSVQVADFNETMWSFSLDLIDLTGTPEENDSESLPMSSLALHIADISHPHNPKVSATLVATGVAQTLESFHVDEFRFVSWLISIANGSKFSSRILTCTHNGTAAADATTTDESTTRLADIGEVNCNFGTILVGSGTSQQISLVANGEINTVISFRRIKL